MTFNFSGKRVLVVGDVMLDHFVVGDVERISPEAPVPIVRYERDERRVGGAANVAHNITALGGTVDLVGVIGASDESGARLREELATLGINHDGLIADPDRKTTTKLRVVTRRNQQVARVDYETDSEVRGAVATEMRDRLSDLATRCDVVVVSDYLKGAVTTETIAHVRARRSDVPVIVDPKIPHLSYYKGASLITPNHHEAEVATHLRVKSDDEAAESGRVFQERSGADAVLITRGERGMTLWHAGRASHFPALAREVADVSGAGDTVVAALALAIAAGASLADAARLANVAASLVVAKFGPAVVTPDELAAALTER